MCLFLFLINKTKRIMIKNGKQMRRLIKECFEEGIQDVIAPEQMAILTFEEVVDLIMLTVAALKADNIIISESQKEKDKRRLHIPQRVITKRRV